MISVELIETQPLVLTVEMAERGPPGPAGGATIQRIANGALGGHRLVVGDGDGGVIYADPSAPSHAGAVIGMTTAAVADGELIPIAIDGEIVESGWSWTIGPVFLGANGVPTQTPPSTGFLLAIGAATSATSVVLNIHAPIILN